LGCRDIVISGAAIACPLGLSREAVFARLCSGECGTGMPLTELESKACVETGGGQAPSLPGGFCPEHPRETRYLRHVAIEALRQANIGDLPDKRVGAVVGSTLHGIRGLGRYLRTNDARNLLHIPAGDTLARALKGLGVDAIRVTNCSACSSGLSSIALACDLLRAGMIDVALAGGYDPIAEYAHAGFASLRLVASGPCTPFCVGREGMKVAEGYGLVVLERHSDAVDRGASVLAHVAGAGETADVYHLTHPDPEGKGASRAVELALHKAGCSASDINLVIAHATGTPANDLAEHAALMRVFGDRLGAIPTVPFKATIGHTLGGAGAVELVLSLMCRERGVIPPSASLANKERGVVPLRIVTGEPEPCDITHSVQLSMGFGGANACVVLSPRAAKPAREPPSHEVMLTGVGVVIPGAVGNDAFARLLSDPRGLADLPNAPDLDANSGLLRGRRVRRMSAYSKLTVAATSLALEHAGIQDVEAFGAHASAILGTLVGGADYTRRYYSQIVEEGLGAANPMLFAEGVPNAAAAQLGMAFGVQGGCQTIIGTRTAGLDALAVAVLRIQRGVWTRAIVSAADEHSELTAMGMRLCANAEFPSRIGSGAVSLILESARVATGRNASPIAMLTRPHLAFASRSEQANDEMVCQVLARAIGEGVSAAIGCSPKTIAEERTAAQTLGVEHFSMASATLDVMSAGPLVGVAAAALGAEIDGRVTSAETSVVATDGAGSVSSIRVRRAGAGI
jgi:3-oxoacyl-[acyl-carrier-protein] synthase II